MAERTPLAEMVDRIHATFPAGAVVDLIIALTEGLPSAERLHVFARFCALHLLPHDRPTTTH
jgi:hypothetical protein